MIAACSSLGVWCGCVAVMSQLSCLALAQPAVPSPPPSSPPISPTAPPPAAPADGESVTVKWSYLLASARAAMSQRAFSERSSVTIREFPAEVPLSPTSITGQLLSQSQVIASANVVLRYQPPSSAPIELPGVLRIEAGRISSWSTKQSLTILAEDVPAAAVQYQAKEPLASPFAMLHSQGQLPRMPLPQCNILFDDEAFWLIEPIAQAGKLTWPAQISLTVTREDAPIIVHGSGPHGPAMAEFDQRSAHLTRLIASLPNRRVIDVQIARIPHLADEVKVPEIKDRTVLASFEALIGFKPPAPVTPSAPPAQPDSNAQPNSTAQPSSTPQQGPAAQPEPQVPATSPPK
jgi:hypothetical protein